MTIEKVRKGPEVSIEYECRGCEYLQIIVGMCDLSVRCHDKGWKGFKTVRHQAPIYTPDKCRFKKAALKEFVKNIKKND